MSEHLDEPWEPITYGDEYERHGVDVLARLIECPVCACAVVADNRERHAESHRATERQQHALLELAHGGSVSGTVENHVHLNDAWNRNQMMERARAALDPPTVPVPASPS